MIGVVWRVLPVLPPFEQKVAILLVTTSLIFEVFAIIFMFKNCIDKLKQVQLRCVIVSVKFFFGFLTGSIVFIVLMLPYWNHVGNGGVAMYSYMLYGSLTYAILFAKAATRLRDIFSFDVMKSKGGFLWNIWVHFNLFSPIIIIVVVLMSSWTMYYN